LVFSVLAHSHICIRSEQLAWPFGAIVDTAANQNPIKNDTARKPAATD